MQHYLSEDNILLFLLQIFLLLGLARALGEVLRRWNQPTITAEILVGVLLGPTVLGRFLPGVHAAVFPDNVTQQTMLETVAWFGIFFFLLKTGLEMDFSSAWRQRGDAAVITMYDVIVPIAIAFSFSMLLPDQYLGRPDQRLLFCLFVATIMTISALPATARVLQDLNLYKTELGFLIMCALSLNDIIGWVIFTLVLGLVTQTGLNVGQAVFILVFTVAFTFLCLGVGRRATDWTIRKMQARNLPEPGSSLTFVCLLGLLCGSVTLKIGIHALFGFFIAGIMAGESQALSERSRNVISQMVHAIFVPLFFATIGLKIDFFSGFDLFLVVFILAIGIAGRFIGAWVGVTRTKQARANRLLIAIAHTPGGEMQIVVSILALEYGLITEPVFVAIVFGAVASSAILGPWMNWALRRRKEVSVEEFMLRRGVLGELKAAARDEAIAELCELVGRQEHLPDKDELTSAVLAREQGMGTAVEEGVAIPHARLESLRSPVIAVGRSVSGIDWNSPDGKPTHLIFLVLTPVDQAEAQLQILRAICIAMSRPPLREQLLKAEGSDGFWRALLDIFARQRVRTP